jgi:phosphohistidine phosphatase
MMAERLAKRGEHLQIINSSTAIRALSIAEPIASALSCKLTESPELYTFSAKALLSAIHDLPDNCDQIAVVGHNPAITDVVNHFINEPIDNIPTSGIVALDSNVNQWDKLNRHNCRMDYFDFPKKEN